MKDVVEVRHYINQAGRDVFDGWLSELADTRTQAKIAARIILIAAGGLRLGTSATASLWARVCVNCGSIGDLATGFITA